MDIFINNIPAIATIIVAFLVQYVGYRLGKFKDEADKKKITIDAADGFRDDLMKQNEELHKRIDAKDTQIDLLRERIGILEDKNRSLQWDLNMRSYQIETQAVKIADLEASLLLIREQLRPKSE